ncbi:hypothetical protein ABIB40_002747 [Pedobacter sp. UYP30]
MGILLEKIFDSNNIYIRWVIIGSIFILCLLPIYKLGMTDGKTIEVTTRK